MKLRVSLAALAVLGTMLSPTIAKDKTGTDVHVSTKPGSATVTESIKATGVVEAIDPEKHHVTLKDSHGKLIPLEIGPDARNLEQVKVGDQVHAVYTEGVVLSMD